jgi:hypothetical protein
MTPDVLTLIIGTLILALTYGAFWHNQPARRRNDDRGEPRFPLGSLVNRALEWLVLMPHVSNPVEKKEPFFLSGKSVMPDRQTEFFRLVLRALRGLNPRRRTLVARKGNTNTLAVERAA